MPNGQGQSGFGDNKPKNHEPKHEKKSESADKGDYANQFWHKIEGSIAKDKLGHLKENVKVGGTEANPEGLPRRKKRRRRRSKGNREGDPQGQQQQKPNLEKPKLQEEKKSEQAAPASPFSEPAAESPFEQPAAPASPFGEPAAESPFEQPVPRSPFDEPAAESPFDESKLPPKPYEEEAKRSKEKEEVEAPVVSETEIIEDEQPINPFEMGPTPKPLDQKSLDDKPLERVQNVNEPESSFYEEEKSAEEMGEAAEVQAPGLENVIQDFSQEEETFKAPPESKENAQSQEAEVVESEAETQASEPVKEDETGIEDFKEDFWTVLQQAGITKKKLFMIIGGVFAVIFGLLVYFMGWYKIFDFSGDDGGEAPAIEDGDFTGVPVIDGGSDPYDIVSSYIFGLEFNEVENPIIADPIGKIGDSSGFEASFVFGETPDLQEERYVEYVELVTRMQNIYEVDIYELLNLSVDRRAALGSYLEDLNNLINQGSQALQDVEENLANLDAQYEELTTQAEQYEADFFGFVEADFGRAAHDTLELFIETSQEAIAIKARFNAEDILKTKFINHLALLRPRYEDVSANAEAIIKGVKVFDIPGSDIDAIVPLTEE